MTRGKRTAGPAVAGGIAEEQPLPLTGRVHILIADNDPYTVALFRGYLERAGAPWLGGVATTIHEAASGIDAVAKAREVVADGEALACALVDFSLDGDLDGIDTILGLWDFDPDVQCTLVTGSQELGDGATRQRIPAEFANRWDFLCQPVAAFELIQRVWRSLSTWFARRRESERIRENQELLARLAEANRELESTVAERTRTLELRNTELETKNGELQQALRALEAAQSKLLHQEKMASIGQLAAGVAHELNNPIGFVHSNLGTLNTYCEKIERILDAYEERIDPDDAEIAALKRELKLAFLREDLPALIEESREGTERVRKIVTDLKIFSHPAQAKAEFGDLNAGLMSTLNIVHHEIKYSARVVTDLGEIPLVRCLPGQINQVFMNLLVNAAQAMDEFGEIRVVTARDGDDVVITVADNGHGIPADAVQRIFEPFFTTKEAGKGTGLGLSISYDIIRKHGGTLDVDSRPGEGTTFTIRLPIESQS